MLRPLALIGTVGLMAMSISSASAQQDSSCQNCQNGGTAAAPTYHSGEWHYANCDECDNGHCHGCRGCLGRCTKAWPDKGWNPPAMLPVNRDGIWYQNMWPQAWYGNPGGNFISDVPMVYQPTDTTQLGYHYAKVPTWQERNNMLPPTPWPSRFHSRVCVPRDHGCRRCLNGAPAGRACQNGSCPHCQQYSMYSFPQAAGQQVVMMPQGMTMSPVVDAPVTPARVPAQQTSAKQNNKVFGLAVLKQLFN